MVSPSETDIEMPAKAVSMFEQQKHHRAAVRPLKLAHYFVNHTGKTCVVALLLPIIAVVVVVASGALKLSSTDTRDYVVLSDIRTRLDDARVSSRDDNPFLADGADISSIAQLQQSSEMTISLLLRGLREGTSEAVATMDNFNTAANVLTRETAAAHKQIEDDYLALTNYSRFCQRDPAFLDCDGRPAACKLPNSYLNHPQLYGIVKNGSVCGRRDGHAVVSQEHYDRFLNSMFGDDPFLARIYFDANITNTTRSAWAAKSTIPIGAPLPGFNSSNDRSSDQAELFSDWAGDVTDGVNNRSAVGRANRTDVYAVSSALTNSDFNSIIFRDLAFAGVAVVLVFTVIWVHTTSFVLSFVAIFQVLLSFPYAYAIYHFIFRQLYFSTLQILTVFLLLGIGADDVFVFTDAWKQAAVHLGEDADLETRMAWTYRRAVRAMTVTSFTTAAAFFVTATSPLMPISTLGVWAATLVLLQFTLVITVYPCAVVTWHRYWRPRLAVRGFKKVTDEEQLALELATPFWHRVLPRSWRPAVKPPAPGEFRAVERFFRGRWMSFLQKAKYVLIVSSFVLVGLSIWRATTLQTPDETESFLPDTHPIQVASDTLRDAFPRGDADLQLRVWVTWGVSDVDRSGLSRYDVAELGTPQYDDDFDFTKAAVQQHVLDACAHFGGQDDLIFSGDTGIDTVDCWIADYRAWRRETFNNSALGFQDFTSQDELIAQLLQFAASDPAYQAHISRQRVLFNADRTRVLSTEVGFVGSTDAQAPERVMWPVYERWTAVLDEWNGKGVAGGDKAIATAGFPWVWQITQQTLLRSMLQGLVIMVVVALCTLTLATLNWVMSLVATACIVGVICNLLGLIRALGWSLGTTESVSVIIGIGYSFDGVAHMATAYIESEENLRADRLRDALTELAISVLFGALTTFVAGLAMTPTTIVFFTKFAILLMATVTLSLLWSVVFFPAYMLVVGPQNDFGSLQALWNKINCFRRRKSMDENQDVVFEDSEKPGKEGQADFMAGV